MWDSLVDNWWPEVLVGVHNKDYAVSAFSYLSLSKIFNIAACIRSCLTTLTQLEITVALK